MSAVARVLCVVAAFALLAAPSATPASSPATRQVVAYTSRADLDSLADSGVRVLRTLPALHSAVVETSRPLGQQPVVRRELTVEEPALAQTYLPGVAWEWQWDAAEMEAVPDRVLRAAARVKIAVIDSGADLGAPDIRDKDPRTWSVLSRSHRVRDVLGHGTFVSSLAAGSVTNGVGVSGFGGDAKLLVVQAIEPDGYVTDVEEAAAIVYAVKHGAKIINLSIGGDQSSRIERRAIDYAARHGVLIVAAARERVPGDERAPVPGRAAPAARLERARRHRARRRRHSDGRHAGRLLQHRLVPLAGSAGPERLRRGVDGRRLAARGCSVALARLLRLGERDIVRRSRGRRSGRARLGREPVADRPSGGEGTEAERLRRDVERGARLGPPRRGRRGSARSRHPRIQASNGDAQDPRPIHSPPPS